MVQPDPNAAQVEAYVDGLQLHGELDLYGLCARQGGATAAYDISRRLLAAAHRRIPLNFGLQVYTLLSYGAC